MNSNSGTTGFLGLLTPQSCRGGSILFPHEQEEQEWVCKDAVDIRLQEPSRKICISCLEEIHTIPRGPLEEGRVTA